MKEMVKGCEIDIREKERLLDRYGSYEELIWFDNHLRSCPSCTSLSFSMEKSKELLKGVIESELRDARMGVMWDNIKEAMEAPSTLERLKEFFEDVVNIRERFVELATIAVSIMILIALYLARPLSFLSTEPISLASIPTFGTGEITIESISGHESPVMVYSGEGDAAVVILFEESDSI